VQHFQSTLGPIGKSREVASEQTATSNHLYQIDFSDPIAITPKSKKVLGRSNVSYIDARSEIKSDNKEKPHTIGFPKNPITNQSQLPPTQTLGRFLNNPPTQNPRNPQQTPHADRRVSKKCRRDTQAGNHPREARMAHTEKNATERSAPLEYY
jgi:hypothetical protein